MKEMTFDELTKVPSDAPEWLGPLIRGIKLADHVGDVWDSLGSHLPLEWRKWVDQVAGAEFSHYDDAGKSIYLVG